MRRFRTPPVAVAARTHPPGYAFHKYWARKPHNVVRAVLEACGLRPGDLVVDPFCGSGVPLSEAAALGATCVGFDVNPVAIELTRTTLAPPDPARFRAAFSSLLDRVERDLGHLHRIGGRRLRYAVHATVVACASCGARASADAAPRRGRAYLCPACGVRLSFNLENMVATRVVRTVFEDGSAAPSGDGEIVPREAVGACGGPFDRELCHNARILAHRGMRTRDLFTPRNFAVLCRVAGEIAALPEDVRRAARLTLTAAAAQCSRLIAHRNGLTTGGPAWTVPGFWVPPLHVETNPLPHLRARLERTHRGLRHLAGLPGRGAAHLVFEEDAGEGLDRLGIAGRAAAAFLDPPYGDSVPYLEFSALWNGFLGADPDPALDISISDRARGDGTFARWERGLARIVGALGRAMRRDGRVVVTFNNRDAAAWRALLAALQGAGLRCEGAFYQRPAVVSSKAQLAPEGSCVGDVYGVFAPSARRPAASARAISAALRSAVRSGGPLDEGALRRLALTELLRSNADASAVDELPRLVAGARAVC